MSVCQHTLAGLAAARLFIGWQWQQRTSTKLLSCVCLSWVPRHLGLGVLRCVFGVRYAVSGHNCAGTLCFIVCCPLKGYPHRRRIGNLSRIEKTICHTFQWQFISSIRDELEFVFGVNGPRVTITFDVHRPWIQGCRFPFLGLAVSDAKRTHFNGVLFLSAYSCRMGPVPLRWVTARGFRPSSGPTLQPHCTTQPGSSSSRSSTGHA